MKHRAILATLTLALSMLSIRAAEPQEKKWLRIPWEKDLAQAQAVAQRDKKPLLLVLMPAEPNGDIPSEGQKVCKEALSDDEVMALIKQKFVPVWVDVKTHGVPDIPPLKKLHDWYKDNATKPATKWLTTSFYLGLAVVSPDGKQRYNDSKLPEPWKYKETAPKEFLQILQDCLVPHPPAQPADGPGGSTYTHAKVVTHAYGKGGTAYWIMEPAEPKPASAPVLVFNHGWAAVDLGPYDAWIEHVVRRGNIVIYPKYQESALTPPKEFLPNAITAIRDALAELKSGDHVKPDLDKTAVFGHSFGGVISANLAAVATKENLPLFNAVCCVEPGTNGYGDYEDYANILSGTLLLAIAGADDKLVRDTDARRIVKGATSLKKEDKAFLIVNSDDHGKPAISSDHFAPVAALGEGRAVQFYGFWKLFDALCDAAFYNKNRDSALGNTAKQRSMGQWSDGTPVKEIKVEEP